MRIRTKIVLMFSLVIILGTLSMGSFAAMTMNKEVISSAQEKLKSDLALGRALLNENYPGEWAVRDGKLYKGDTLLNENYDVVNEIGNLTGDTATIFLNDTRISTNVQKDGKPAIGTKVSDAVAQVTLKEGKTYIGEAVVVDTINQTAYEPIKNAKGDVIGIWYVGVPNAPYDALIAQFRTQVLLFGGIGLLVAIVLAAAVAEFQSRPLVRLTKVANQVADGDLRVEPLKANRKDEIGQLATSVNRMVTNLHELITQVNVTANQVAVASSELSASTEQTSETIEQITVTIQTVAEGAEHQVSGAARSTTAIEELSTGIERVAETSVAVAEASFETAREAEQGNEAVHHAMEQMSMIQGAVNESADGFKLLQQRSHEIEQIVEVITGIANQTNLLALNAAIEAARAGEHGKGFAVVADEVRKLAEQSGESAGRIVQLIQAIQGETTKAAGSMDALMREVKSGTRVVNEAGQAFQRILASAKMVADQVQDVTASAQEMTANSHQVGESMDEMSTIARESASNAETVAASTEEQLATIEEITASADSLSKMADELRELVQKFRV